MEDIPPSYDDINPEVLDLLPPYLTTPSLLQLCLVSRKYYATFISHLWGSPASHFVQLAGGTPSAAFGTDPVALQVSGANNDMVYVALTRFKKTLRRARLSTRLLCHTLHLPPALSEIYGGPNTTWLREVLDWLPALQTLSVSGLPFFDHHSLMAVDKTRSSSVPTGPGSVEFQIYPVKMLLAAREPNVTSIGLSLLMPHLPNLVYLDLSYTTPARDWNVLSALAMLSDLQVLKLRGLQLKDNDAEVLANAIGLRVRLLDVSENMLTDMAVRSLLQACFLLPTSAAAAAAEHSLIHTANGRLVRGYAQTGQHNQAYSRQHLESWPVGLPPPTDLLSLDTIRTVELDKALVTQLTNPLTGRLAFEDIPHGGITHLYINGNPGITVEGIRSVLDLGRLHVLDAGDIGALTAVDLQVLSARRKNYSVKGMRRNKSISGAARELRSFIHKHRSPPGSTYSDESAPIDELDEDDEVFNPLNFPGAEKLIPVLHEKASRNLTHLRIEHKVVTAVLDMSKESKSKDKKIENKQELPGSAPMASEVQGELRYAIEAPGSRTYATEVPADTQVFEMDGTSVVRAELPGDIIHFAISPPVNAAPREPDEEVIMTPIRGEGAYAPEVAEDETNNDDENTVPNASSSGLRRHNTESTRSTISSIVSPLQPTSPAIIQSAIVPPSPLQINKPSLSTITDPSSIPRTVRLGQIQDLIKLRPKTPVKLHPSYLPNLRTLVLTNLPTTIEASSAFMIENIKEFITACAAETRLASLRAQTNYSLPPGRARQDAERNHARTLFALRTIVLEVSNMTDKDQQRSWKHTRQRLDISKSSTGDHDSEALWSAAENDFSFFGEEGEERDECGIYAHEQDKYYPTIPFDDKIAITSSEDTPFSPSASELTFSSPRSPSLYASNNFGILNAQTPLIRNNTTLQSPRNLPLGRNRRSSNESQRNSPTPYPTTTASGVRSIPRSIPPAEMTGSIPAIRTNSIPTPTTQETSTAAPPPELPRLDVVSEIASWRRERKAAYEAARAEHYRRRHSRSNSNGAHASSAVGTVQDIYIEGYWPGEIKVVRPSGASRGNGLGGPVGYGHSGTSGNASNASGSGRFERSGNVDVYGNYFEGGYLYP